MSLELNKRCEKVILSWPEPIREEIVDALAKLERGQMLSMPLSRPMPDIGKGAHELRFRDRSGRYRVIYVLIGYSNIYLIHAFKKKTQSTSLKDITIAKERLKRITK